MKLLLLILIVSYHVYGQESVILEVPVIDPNRNILFRPYLEDFGTEFLFRTIFTVDKRGLIYLFEPFTLRFIKYNPFSKNISYLKLPDPMNEEWKSCYFFMTTDKDCSLYLMAHEVGNVGSYKGILKYDSAGVLLNNFSLKPRPSLNCQFSPGLPDEITVSTANWMDPGENMRGRYFRYNLKGELIDRSNDLLKYKDYKIKLNYLTITVMKEQKIEYTQTIFDADSMRRYLIGTDRTCRIIYFVAKDNVYSFDIISRQLTKGPYLSIHPNHRNYDINGNMGSDVIMAPNGEVYYLAIGTKWGKVRIDQKYDYKELKYQVIKLENRW